MSGTARRGTCRCICAMPATAAREPWVTGRATSILTTRRKVGPIRNIGRRRWRDACTGVRAASATIATVAHPVRGSTKEKFVGVEQWLAATGVVLLAVLLGGLLFALLSVVATVRQLRTTVERLQTETLAITAAMQAALRDAEHEVDRV